MQKKSTKRRTTSKALATRAKAIINGAYDEDTRKSIQFELKTNDPDLADMVKRPSREKPSATPCASPVTRR